MIWKGLDKKIIIVFHNTKTIAAHTKALFTLTENTSSHPYNASYLSLCESKMPNYDLMFVILQPSLVWGLS